jgi:hypothetical protein
VFIQQLSQMRHVVVAKTNLFHPRKLAGMVQAGVVQAVGEHKGLSATHHATPQAFVQQCGQPAGIGLVAA